MLTILQKNTQIKEKCSNLEGKTLLCCCVTSRQASCREVSPDSKEEIKNIGHFVNRLGNGKTMHSMLEANGEKGVGGSKKRSFYKGY